MTVKDVANGFFNHKQALLDAGEVSPRTWAEYEATTDLLISQFGKGRLVADIGPDDFAALRARIAARRSRVCLGNDIQRVRSRFKHGVNCGYGNADCGTLSLSGLDMERGWARYHRPKTGIDRRCPLWPETVAALRDALAKRQESKDEAGAGLVFITKYGEAWFKGDTNNPLRAEMRKLLDSLGINGNRNFYALRHTCETIGGEAKDQVAVDHITGHARDDMASAYRERISDERLKAVTDHVRKVAVPADRGRARPKGRGRRGGTRKQQLTSD